MQVSKQEVLANILGQDSRVSDSKKTSPLLYWRYLRRLLSAQKCLCEMGAFFQAGQLFEKVEGARQKIECLEEEPIAESFGQLGAVQEDCILLNQRIGALFSYEKELLKREWIEGRLESELKRLSHTTSISSM